MAEIELRIANMSDCPLLTKIDLDFDSEFVWTSQIMEELDSYSINLQKIKLPKIIHVAFQANNSTALENMVKRKEVLIARYENQIVGFSRIETDETGNQFIIKTGGVKPDYRKKGIGTAILTGVQEMAQQNRVSRLVFTLQAKNDPAIHFLMGRGFQFCGYQEFYFSNYEIALFFSKNIR